jgi:hypothetical protein
MKKTLMVVFGVIVAVIIGLAISAQAPEPDCSAVIKFVTCPDEEDKAMMEHTRYEVERGDKVWFVNKSEVTITLTFEECNLFVNQNSLELESGERGFRIVRQDAEECMIDLQPTCIKAGPIIIPEP